MPGGMVIDILVSNILEKAKDCYNRSGDRRRQSLKPFFRLYRRYARHLLHVRLFRGTTRANNLPLSCLYIGDDLFWQNQWLHTLFRNKPEKKFAGRYLPSRLEKILSHCKGRADICLLEPKPAVKNWPGIESAFRLPRWVQMEIDISRPMEAMEKDSPKGFGRIRRQIERYGYWATLSRQSSDFDDFYFNMYTPYISHRFGNRGVVMDYGEMRKMFDSSELFLLHKDKAAVAGGLVHYRRNDASFAFFGARDGDIELVRQGAMGACYFFIIRHLAKKGFKTLKIGGVSPFLKDGRFRYKARLLARIDNAKTYAPSGCMFLLLLNDTAGSRDFLVDQPFVFHLENKGLFSAHWVQDDGLAVRKRFSRNVSLSERVDLRGCRIFALGEAVFSENRWEGIGGERLEVEDAGAFFERANRAA